jgi:hypothetical protein
MLDDSGKISHLSDRVPHPSTSVVSGVADVSPALAPGQYTIRAEMIGYQPEEKRFDVIQGRVCRLLIEMRRIP